MRPGHLKVTCSFLSSSNLLFEKDSCFFICIRANEMLCKAFLGRKLLLGPQFAKRTLHVKKLLCPLSSLGVEDSCLNNARVLLLGLLWLFI